MNWIEAGGRMLALALVLMVLPGTARAEQKAGAADLATRLSALRAEVETLSATLDGEREGTRAQLRSLATQRADLELELQREELRLKQLRSTQARQRARVQRSRDRKDAFAPLIREAIGQVRAAVAAGLPFQTAERLAEFDRLLRQLDDGTMTSPTVLTRLWAKVEDEFRLARESGIYRQVIRVGGEEMLAEVARVGMVMLFFRTRDGRFGRAHLEQGDWSYRLYGDEAQIRQVAALFDAFKKRIRTGVFQLPWELSAEVDR